MKRESLRRWIDALVILSVLAAGALFAMTLALTHAAAAIGAIVLLLGIGWVSGIRERFIELLADALRVPH